jgi:hypothetical protein
MTLYILTFEINAINYIGSITENAFSKPFHSEMGHIITVVVHQIGHIYPIAKPKLSIDATIASIVEKRSIHLPRPGRSDMLIQFHARNPKHKERHLRMINFIEDGSYDYTSYKKYTDMAHRLQIKPKEKRAFLNLFNFVYYKEPIDDPDYGIPNYEKYEENSDDKNLPQSPYEGNY